MKVTILGSGTSTGVPEVGCRCEVCTSPDPHDKRLRASVLVETGTEDILIDCGPDFRYQMIRSGTTHLDGLLLTHIHYDHVGGMDDLRPFCRHQAMQVFAERRVSDSLRDKYAYMFQDHKYPGIPDIDLITIHRHSFVIGSTEVIPIRLFHYKLPVLGYRIGDFAYLTDFTILPESELYKLNGVKLLIMDALRKTKHLSHLSLDEALVIQDMIGAERTVFTHMSHQMGLHAVVNEDLPPHVSLGFDGMQLEI
ncbi:MAG: MBL fold metallo-hydrolase [Bacteroidales bacterium]